MTGNAILAVTAARLGIFLGACAVVGLCVFLVCYSLTKRLKVTEIFADVKDTERTAGYASIGEIYALHYPMVEV